VAGEQRNFCLQDVSGWLMGLSRSKACSRQRTARWFCAGKPKAALTAARFQATRCLVHTHIRASHSDRVFSRFASHGVKLHAGAAVCLTTHQSPQGPTVGCISNRRTSNQLNQTAISKTEMGSNVPPHPGRITQEDDHTNSRCLIGSYAVSCTVTLTVFPPLIGDGALRDD
jgi:hypothetical protein